MKKKGKRRQQQQESSPFCDIFTFVFLGHKGNYQSPSSAVYIEIANTILSPRHSTDPDRDDSPKKTLKKLRFFAEMDRPRNDKKEKAKHPQAPTLGIWFPDREKRNQSNQLGEVEDRAVAGSLRLGTKEPPFFSLYPFPFFLIGIPSITVHRDRESKEGGALPGPSLLSYQKRPAL